MSEPKGLNTKWPGRLKEYFVSKYNFRVEPFIWDGGRRNGLSDSLIEEYQKHLVSLYNSMTDSQKEKGIVVFAKSYGGIIAERALNNIYKTGVDFKCEKLVRMATPDLRRKTNTQGDTMVIDIYSDRDILFYLALIPLSIFIYLFYGYKNGIRPIFKYKIKNLRHNQLNTNILVNIAGIDDKIYLFDFYAYILNNKLKNFKNKKP